MRLIDADTLHDIILRDKKLDGKDVNWAVNRIISHILNTPTIEPTTVYEFKGCDNCELDRPKGKWIEHLDEKWGGVWHTCSNCYQDAPFEQDVYNNWIQKLSDFCPNCGADMR